MTKQEIADIRALCEAATPGPYEHDEVLISKSQTLIAEEWSGESEISASARSIILQLLNEIERLEKERGAAVEDIPHMCEKCKYAFCNNKE